MKECDEWHVLCLALSTEEVMEVIRPPNKHRSIVNEEVLPIRTA